MTRFLAIAANIAFVLGYLPQLPEGAFGPKTSIERAMERFPDTWVVLLQQGKGRPVAIGDTVAVEFVATDSRGVNVADTSIRGMPFSVRIDEQSDWHFLTFEMKVGERRRVTFRPSSDKSSVYTIELRLVRIGM